MKTMMIAVAAVLAMGVSAQAAEVITCHSKAFPAGLGSQLKVTVQDNVVTDVQLTVNENKGVFNANGFFRPHFAVNENNTEVVYLSWYAGMYTGAESKDLVPNKMVFYSFDHFLSHNQVMVGVIKNTENGKTENQYRFICQ